MIGGAQAAKTLLQIQTASMKKKGEAPDVESENLLLNQITERYNRQTSPYYAAARLWVDGIIDPLETRKVVSIGIEAANQSPITEKFSVGVIQT